MPATTTISSRYGDSFSSIQYQVLSTVVANLCCLVHGCAIGWASPTLPLLRSDASPLAAGAVDIETAAWIGAVISLGGIAGTLCYGIASNYIGSKTAMFYCVVPVMTNWCIIYWAECAWLLIVARGLAGFGAGGLFICIPLYVAEIAHERVRGQLGSLLMLNFNVGIVLGYGISSSLAYRTVPLVMLVPPILFTVIFAWLPSTPQFLLKCSRTVEAETSLRFYRNAQRGATSESDEQLLSAELKKLAQIAQQNERQPPLRCSDFCRRSAIGALLIGPTLLACSQFSGSFTLCNYANTIFAASGTHLDANVASMIMGSIQVCGTVCSWWLIDRVGRRVLLLVSSAGGAGALFVTATFSYLNQRADYDMAAWNGLPVVSLSFFIFISSIGMTTVPYVLVVEVLPAHIRRVGSTACIASVSVFSFVVLRWFPVMLEAVQLHGCMWFGAAAASTAFVFTLVTVRETKGMNLDQLQTAAVSFPQLPQQQQRL